MGGGAVANFDDGCWALPVLLHRQMNAPQEFVLSCTFGVLLVLLLLLLFSYPFGAAW